MLGMLGAERTLPCSLAGSSKRSVFFCSSSSEPNGGRRRGAGAMWKRDVARAPPLGAVAMLQRFYRAYDAKYHRPRRRIAPATPSYPDSCALNPTQSRPPLPAGGCGRRAGSIYNLFGPPHSRDGREEHPRLAAGGDAPAAWDEQQQQQHAAAATAPGGLERCPGRGGVLGPCGGAPGSSRGRQAWWRHRHGGQQPAHAHPRRGHGADVLL